MDLVDESLDAALRRASVRRLRTLVAVASCAMAIIVGVVVMAVGSSRNEKAGASTIDGSVLVPLSADELAAADSEMWDQLSSGWVAYGSYDAETLAPVRGWVHLKGTPESVDFDLVQSQNETNFGGLPVFDGRDGIQIGVHFSMVGFVALSDAPAFDQTAARLRKFGCDPLAADVEAGQQCMANVIAAENAKVGELRVAGTN